MERGDEAWEERLIVALYRSLKLHNAPDNPEERENWQLVRRLLHHEALSATRSPLLLRMLSDLASRMERYVNLFADMSTHFKRDYEAEHRSIVEALIARDRPRLESVIDRYFALGQPLRDSIVERLQAGARPERRETAATAPVPSAPPKKKVVSRRQKRAS
jgi:DNA-binding GntR family transcriptional regulator